jgi:hypothetical protein
MNWLIVFIGGVSLAIALWLMFSKVDESRIMPGEQGGLEETPYAPKQLVPIRYDRKWGEKLQFQHEEMLRNSSISLEEARKTCHEMRKYDSAVVEVNFAKITLTQVERYGSRMDNVQFQEHRHSINEAIERAKYFTKHHEQNRYPPEIEDHLKNLENRLDRLTKARDR